MVVQRERETVRLQDELLRDGLQMESRIFTPKEKLHLFQQLQKAGIKQISVGSFVNPDRVPQMADTANVVKRLGQSQGIVASALVLNEKGLERALACGIQHVSLSASVSDTHSRKNANRPAGEAIAAIAGLIQRALAAGINITGGLQCVFGCVYEGKIPERSVLDAVEKLVQAGAREINIADTTGMATPRTIRKMIQRIDSTFPGIEIALHLHDTRGLGLANMYSGYEAGVRMFDVCTGGLGGCPFVTGAAGNVPTEDAVHMFEAMGIATGIDLKKICSITAYLEGILCRMLPGRMGRVLQYRHRHDKNHKASE